MYHDLGTKVTLLEYLPSIVPARGPRGQPGARAQLHAGAGMTVMTNARFDAAKVEVDEGRASASMVGPEGKEQQELRAEMLLVATGRATNVEEIGLETTKAEIEKGFVKVDGRMRTREPHLYAIGDVVGGLMLAHTAGHEGIVAAHVIAGDKDVHPIDYVEAAAGDVLPARDRLDRADPAAVPRSRASPIKVGKVPFQAIAKAIIGGEYEGFAKVIGNKETDDTLGVHVIGPHATDLIAEASLAFELEATPWEIGGVDPSPTRRSARSSARRRWPSTAGRSTSDGAVYVEAPWPRSQGRELDLGASVGLTDDDLLEMYRLVALARAVDERMWILNRAGRIPFVISGQGHEGAQVGDRLAAREGQGLDRAVLPLDRDVPDVRDEARDILTAQYAKAIDPSSGGRQMPGHYGIVTSTTSSRFVAGRDPAAPRGRDRAGGEDPQDRPGGDDVDGRGQSATRATSTRA